MKKILFILCIFIYPVYLFTQNINEWGKQYDVNDWGEKTDTYVYSIWDSAAP